MLKVTVNTRRRHLPRHQRKWLTVQIKIALVEHGHADIVKECVKKSIEDGYAWVAASLSLELLRKGRLNVGSALISKDVMSQQLNPDCIVNVY